MSSQLRFFRKNLIDLDQSNVTFAITDSVATSTGDSFVNLMLNRNNESGWGTIGSSDAGTTTLVLTFTDILQFDTVILTNHNLKSYTLKYWDDIGLSWTDFSTAVAPTTNTEDTTFHQFTAVNSSKIQLIINGTQTADADKFISQIIVTRKIQQGQLEGWPIIKKPSIDLNKKAIQTISGKSKIIERVGAFNCSLDFSVWPSDNDLLLLEDIHFYHPRGFLFWPSAGDDAQFRYKRIGFRNKDIYLCGVTSEWQPEWEKGIYVNGVNINVRLTEVI